MTMRTINLWPSQWGYSRNKHALTSSASSKPKIAEVAVGVFLIVIFGSLAMIHSLMLLRPQSLLSAALYAFVAAQGFRFFGKTDSLALRGSMIALVCMLMGMIIGIG